MKLFQYDKKVWDTGNDVSHTWQFGIIKDKSLLWVNYETPGAHYSATGGLNILISLVSHSSLFGVSFQHRKFEFAFHLFTDYFDGWN